ncbi:hypothetical protein [Actinotalea sp. K2]|uniref:hypothetical protein n=1 Tax=Actinotalea sp. K2 TaxID=2939438 RepID=UPI00201748C3|nr:hypothetical protein [Actinotalea sp. K2]MCL3859877.1 hypothetical protein [Actinotalea sp. K2]
MTTTLRTATASGGMALLLVLAGCSTGGGDESSTPEAGPLDAFFEQMYGEWSEEDSNAKQNEVEEITARCMQDLGFEYTPVDYSSMSGGSYSSDDLDVEWGSKEFAEKYGYGATTDPWGDAEEPMPDEGEGQEWFDPNQEYLESMSETEQAAYYEALYGVQTFDESDPEAEVEWDWEQAGCSGKAQHEVWDTDGGFNDPQFEALQEEMNTMWESSMNDPRVTELNSKWSTCMADAGYSGFAAVGDAENSIHERVNAIYDGYEWTEDSTEEDWEAFQATVDSQLAEITEEEIATAVADWECKDKIRYDKVQRDVNFEYQQEFVDAHKAELEAWVAAFNEAS